MAIASLVLGILSLVIGLFLSAYGWAGAILGIVGIVLGALGRKDAAKKGMATAGLVCSIIGTVLGIIFYIACVACAKAIVDAANAAGVATTSLF